MRTHKITGVLWSTYVVVYFRNIIKLYVSIPRKGHKRTQSVCEYSVRVCFADPVALGVAAVELFGLGFALHHRVHSFQVRRVGHQRQSDVPVSHTVYPPVVHAQVVLHIS